MLANRISPSQQPRAHSSSPSSRPRLVSHRSCALLSACYLPSSACISVSTFIHLIFLSYKALIFLLLLTPYLCFLGFTSRLAISFSLRHPAPLSQRRTLFPGCCRPGPPRAWPGSSPSHPPPPPPRLPTPTGVGIHLLSQALGPLHAAGLKDTADSQIVE